MRKSFVPKAIAMVTAFLSPRTSAQAFASCPASPVFPKLVGMQSHTDLVTNETMLVGIDYSVEHLFVVACGWLQYNYASISGDPLGGFTSYCDGPTCSSAQTPYGYQDDASKSGLLQLYSTESYEKQHQFLMTDYQSSKMTKISAVKVLQLDQRYTESKSTAEVASVTDPTALEFSYDKSLDVLVALFVEFYQYPVSTQQIMFVTVRMSDDAAPITVRKAYNLPSLPNEWTSYTSSHSMMSFVDMDSKDGLRLGPTVIAHAYGVTQSNQLVFSPRHSFMNFGQLDSQVVITGSKVHPNTRKVYLLGHYNDYDLVNYIWVKYPLMIKCELQATSEDGLQFTDVETFKAQRNIGTALDFVPSNTFTDTYVDVAWLGSTAEVMNDEHTEVLLRCTTSTDFNDGFIWEGMIVDIIKNYSDYTSTFKSVMFSDDGGSFLYLTYGTSIGCHESSCLINAWSYDLSEHYKPGGLRIISIQNMHLSNTDDWSLTTKDLTDSHLGSYQALSSAIYYISSTSTLTSFFSYSSNRYGYESGPGEYDWLGVDYQETEAVSIVASSSSNDCIAILEVTEGELSNLDMIKELASMQDADYWDEIVYKLSVESITEHSPTTDSILVYKEERVSNSQIAQMLTEPWFGCTLNIEQATFADGTAQMVFNFNDAMESDDATFMLGGAALESATSFCRDQTITNVLKITSDREPSLDLATIENDYADIETCYTEAVDTTHCVAAYMSKRIRELEYFGSDNKLKLKLPYDLEPYDGETLHFLISYASSSVPVEYNQSLQITWALSGSQSATAPEFTSPPEDSYDVSVGEQVTFDFGAITGNDALDTSFSITFGWHDSDLSTQTNEANCVTCPMRLDSDNTLHVDSLEEYFLSEEEQYITRTDVKNEIEYACYITVTSTTTSLSTSYNFIVVLSQEISIEQEEIDVPDEFENIDNIDNIEDYENVENIENFENQENFEFQVDEQYIITEEIFNFDGNDPSGGYNPATGYGYDPATGQGYDPATGQGYDPTLGYDPATGNVTAQYNDTAYSNDTAVENQQVVIPDPSLYVDPNLPQAEYYVEETIIEEEVTSVSSTTTIVIETKDAVSNILGIENPEQVRQESSVVTAIDEDTDLEAAAAAFDWLKFMKEKGLALSEEDDLDSLPPLILQQKLEEKYAIPDKAGLSNTGELVLGFSNQVDAKDSTALGSSLPKVQNDEEKANLMLRNLNAKIESNGNGEIIVALDVISELLLQSKSIITELVPGTENYLDKKSYTWKVVEYKSNKVRIAFEFLHPEYISVGELDTMKVTFNNTDAWLQPLDFSKLPTPNLYVEVIKIPPQGTDLLSSLEIQSVKTQAQTFILGNILARTVFKQAMAMLFGSIIMVQILAHLPLSGFILPANVIQTFEIMQGIVSFDYFQPTEYFDLGFTVMHAWSPFFAELGYESINFIEGMGSILIMALIQIFNILVAILLAILKVKCCCSWGINTYSPVGVSSQTLNFIHGVFFEVLICVSTSMGMVQYREYFNNSDKWSVALQFIFMAFLVSYILFVTYFTLFKTGDYVTKNLGEVAKENTKVLEVAHSQLLRSISKSQKDLLKFERKKEELDQLFTSTKSKQEELIRKASTIKHEQFDKFQPLISDLRKDSRLAMCSNFYINVRRLSMLYMAMFLTGGEWGFIQVQVFMVQNLLSLMFLVVIMPYEMRANNYLNIFNESISLLVSYFITSIVDVRNVEYQVTIGEFINNTIYFSWFCNILVIAYFIVKEVYEKLRKKYYHKFWVRFVCCHPKKDLPKGNKNDKKEKEKAKVAKTVKNIDSVRFAGRSVSSQRAQSLLSNWHKSKKNESNADSQRAFLEEKKRRFQDSCEIVEEIELQTVREPTISEGEEIDDVVMDGVTNTNYPASYVNTGRPSFDFFSGASMKPVRKMTYTQNIVEIEYASSQPSADGSVPDSSVANEFKENDSGIDQEKNEAFDLPASWDRDLEPETILADIEQIRSNEVPSTNIFVKKQRLLPSTTMHEGLQDIE